VIGTWVSQVYKEREIHNELHQKEIETSNKLFYDLVESFSKRHFYALLADRAVERWNDKGDRNWRYGEGRDQMNDAYRLYEQSVTDWNLGRFKMEAILQTHFGGMARSALDKHIIPILGQTEDDLDDLREFANYHDFYAIYLHDSALKRIEGEEENAIQGFFDYLSQSLKEHEKPKHTWFFFWR
jgi:hypothetical protein